MAVSMVSTRAVDLACVGGPYFEFDGERFIVLKEKSWGGLQPDIFIRLGMFHQPLGRSGAD